MTRILLADDSPHAQRMGEHILREEGFEVVSVTDGETALVRLPDVDPDIVLADVFLPGRSGFELCRFVKNSPQHRHAKVLLTAGLLEPFDEAEARDAGSDGILRKPFEASAVMELLRPLAESATAARAGAPDPAPAIKAPQPGPAPKQTIDAERVRAAVTLALDAAMPKLIDEITERVLIALGE